MSGSLRHLAAYCFAVCDEVGVEPDALEVRGGRNDWTGSATIRFERGQAAAVRAVADRLGLTLDSTYISPQHGRCVRMATDGFPGNDTTRPHVDNSFRGEQAMGWERLTFDVYCWEDVEPSEATA